MDKQFKLYSVDTKAFYTEKETNLNKEKFEILKEMAKYEEWEYFKLTHDKEIGINEYYNKLARYKELKKLEGKNIEEDNEFEELKQYFKKISRKNSKKEYKTAQELKKDKEILEKITRKQVRLNLKDNEDYLKLKHKLKEIGDTLSYEITSNKKLKRELLFNSLSQHNMITLFENSLSRAFGIEADEVVTSMVIVRIYHYSVMEQLIKNGFTYTDSNGDIKEYRVFTASAGQIRTKKVIFIERDVWDKYEKTLMCGLTIPDINNSSEKGCNINKFLAYLALCNSATDELIGFNIDKAIVIEDFETLVNGDVDYVDNKTFEVTRKNMDVLIPHSDGCGWVLPSVSNKNFMIRLPWVKGLVTPVDYLAFCDKYNNGNYKIVDIYGKEWDLKKDNIEYVFSKSQFKMYKYYKNTVDEHGEILEFGWDKYVRLFKENECKANYCNLEPGANEFRQANFNYQMWQTLTDITNEEIESFTKHVDEYITKGYTDMKAMLDLLGANDDNITKSNLQKCINVYPELIKDKYIKDQLASCLNARKKEAKYGKFKINATYTFLIPDVFAWMQNVFLGEKHPKGLLKDGEVCCRLYKDDKELLVNRSPHLYREHAVRNNIINGDTSEWFCTDGVYTSSHDLISKILQFDVDGDKGLVIADKRLIPIAKRNMKNIVPLYYEMGKAGAMVINEDNIYDSLTKAFKFNNIGKFSNKLTVLWNSDNPNLETIAQITALNNFTIDAAKTLLVPKVPKHVEEDMKESNGKLPYFMQFAKDKDVSEVAPINDSTVNRICRNIENIKVCNYDFSEIGNFNKNRLMNNHKTEIIDGIIEKYKQLEKEKIDYIIKTKTLKLSSEEVVYPNKYIRTIFENECNEHKISLIEGLDMVVKYIYITKKTASKSILFECFGDIIYNNLKNNLKGTTVCKCCGIRTEDKNNKTLYCKKCAKNENIRKTKENKQKSLICKNAS